MLKQIGTISYKIRQVWTNKNKFGPIRTISYKLGQVHASLDKFLQVWTSSYVCECPSHASTNLRFQGGNESCPASSLAFLIRLELRSYTQHMIKDQISQIIWEPIIQCHGFFRHVNICLQVIYFSNYCWVTDFEFRG